MHHSRVSSFLVGLAHSSVRATVRQGMPTATAGARGLTCSGALPSPGLVLNDGRIHPQIGFGTYKVGFIPASASAAAAGAEDAGAQGPTAKECVVAALGVGYRMLDCAQFYGNEAEVGAAIAESGVAREELYLASKCWTNTIFDGPGAVRAQVMRTLEDLGTSYLDLYLVHWPVPFKHVDAYVELQALKEEGLINSIGVSNYAVEDYEVGKVQHHPDPRRYIAATGELTHGSQPPHHRTTAPPHHRTTAPPHHPTTPPPHYPTPPPHHPTVPLLGCPAARTPNHLCTPTTQTLTPTIPSFLRSSWPTTASKLSRQSTRLR